VGLRIHSITLSARTFGNSPSTSSPCPRQMRSPAIRLVAGLTTCHFPWPHFTTSPWCMPDCCRRLQSGAVGSFIDRFVLPLRLHATQPPLRLFSPAPVPRPGIILRLPLEGGRCLFASGTPTTRGAHNGETPMQQPDQTFLVRESVPSRIAEALSVDAFRRFLSRRTARHFRGSATNCRLSDTGQ
jgi:hypothetical protein